MPPQVRVRRDIWSLEGEQTWHPITRAYALAVGEMKARDATDPTSLAYQAQIHGMPDLSQPDQFRGQCQHRCWFFLPWHRLYLHWFDQVVLSLVRASDDVDYETKEAWALPYWNYSEAGQRATLPPAFREPQLPEGGDNPLFVDVRNQFVNDGEELDPFDTDISQALAETMFSLPAPAGGFGGAATGFNHFNQDPNRFTGKVEATPHNTVHGAVGGHMLGFDTAGLDPVFWMHHANIDRLWSVWIGQGVPEAPHDNPDPGGPWGTTVSHFHDPENEPVSGSAAGVLDTAADLGYEYEDTSLPESRRPARRRRTEVPSGPPPDNPPELVGATEEAVELAGATTRVQVAVGEPSGPARRAEGREPERVYLTVEGIEGDANPGFNYAVLLNLPDDADPDEEPETYYAGTVSFFGIEQTRSTEAAEGAHGLAQSFDITDLVAEQRESDTWDPASMTVTFMPTGPAGRRRRSGGEEQREGPPVKLGRVGVYFQ